MSVIKVTLPVGEIPVSGKQISFTAPCSCKDTEALEIDGARYTVVDALCKCVTGVGGRWDVGAIVSVILDTEKKYAFYQNSWTPTAADVGAVPTTRKVNGKALSSDISLTAADVGAASVEFGLGGAPKLLTSADDMNNVWRSGWYYYMSSSVPTNGKTLEWINIVRVDGYAETVYVQTVYGLTSGETFAEAPTITRRRYGSKITQWEWDNPPLVANSTEYRTTERINRKAVYKRSNGGVIEYRLDGETRWKPYADAVGAARIETGSYVGTGSYGEANPNSLTFSFQPKFVYITDGSYAYVMSPYLWGDSEFKAMISDYHHSLPTTVSGNTMTWYSTHQAQTQLNLSGYTYTYVAIG